MEAIELSLFKPSNQLDFYCQDGYFRAYGEDAILAAKATGFRYEIEGRMPVLSFSLVKQADIVLPRLVRAGFKIRMMEPMMKYALYDYVPRRYWRKASFEQQDICRMILGFKDGRNVYTRWAVYEVSKVLASVSLKDIVIVCIPASTRYAHVRRWKRFSRMLCRNTGAVDGFDRIQVSGSRKRAHVSGEYELVTNIKHYVHIDAGFFSGKKVLVIDDIYTTGQSSDAFIGAIQAAGATVIGALFLAKTMKSHP